METHALMSKVLKSIYIFESENRYIYEHIRTDLYFKQIQSHVSCVSHHIV